VAADRHLLPAVGHRRGLWHQLGAVGRRRVRLERHDDRPVAGRLRRLPDAGASLSAGAGGGAAGRARRHPHRPHQCHGGARHHGLRDGGLDRVRHHAPVRPRRPRRAGPASHGDAAGEREPAGPVPGRAGLGAELGIHRGAAGLFKLLRRGARDVARRGVAERGGGVCRGGGDGGKEGSQDDDDLSGESPVTLQKHLDALA